MQTIQLGEMVDVTSRYAGMLGRDYEGMHGAPWNYGQALVNAANRAAMPMSYKTRDTVTDLANAKKARAAQQAAADIVELPGGKIGSDRPLIIDGSTLFGNSGLLAAALVANTDVLCNTYTVQTGYQVILDPEDPVQQAMFRPYDNTSANAFVNCTVKIDVAEASTGDGNTVFLQDSIVFRPDQNFAAGDKFNKRWERRWIAQSGDLIRTYARLPNGATSVTLSTTVSRIAHRLRVWKVD